MGQKKTQENTHKHTATAVSFPISSILFTPQLFLVTDFTFHSLPTVKVISHSLPTVKVTNNLLTVTFEIRGEHSAF